MGLVIGQRTGNIYVQSTGDGRISRGNKNLIFVGPNLRFVATQLVLIYFAVDYRVIYR